MKKMLIPLALVLVYFASRAQSTSNNTLQNAGIANPSMTINGATCTLGLSCAPSIFTTPCFSGTSPAACGSASAGSVAFSSGNANLVVDTTAVTGSSQILLLNDASATISGVTCTTGGSANEQIGFISARTPGTSFTITRSGTGGNVCLDFIVVN